MNNSLNGNILSYIESEDSYYIQYGADSVPKKLGNSEIQFALNHTSANNLDAHESITVFNTENYAKLTVGKFTSYDSNINNFSLDIVGTNVDNKNISFLSTGWITPIDFNAKYGSHDYDISAYKKITLNFIKYRAHSGNISGFKLS